MSKNGFSYYKAETDRFQDIKIKRLKKKYGCDGYAVYQYALNEIYRVEGAYIRWTEDQLFDCADYWDMNEARVKEIIGYCAEVCLFDPVMWKTQCILTSRAIQSRYLDICKISKKKSYIPLEILLVEPEQPMREPVAMTLFEGGAGAAEHDTPNQATLAEQKFRSKIKQKQNHEKSSSTPPQPSGALTEEEARVLLSSTVLGEDRSSKPDIARHQPPQADAKAEEEKQRNPQGLINTLRPYNLSQRELEEVLQLSRHGEIGNPVWSILAEMHGNKRLKMPRLFLLKRLRDAMGLVAGGSPGGKAKEAS